MRTLHSPSYKRRKSMLIDVLFNRGNFRFKLFLVVVFAVVSFLSFLLQFRSDDPFTQSHIHVHRPTTMESTQYRNLKYCGLRIIHRAHDKKTSQKQKVIQTSNRGQKDRRHRRPHNSDSINGKSRFRN